MYTHVLKLHTYECKKLFEHFLSLAETHILLKNLTNDTQARKKKKDIKAGSCYLYVCYIQEVLCTINTELRQEFQKVTLRHKERERETKAELKIAIHSLGH